MMVDNKTMLCNHSKCTPLTKTYTCKDGWRIFPEGTVTKPDGSTMKLMNGYTIDKNGKVAMIRHNQKGHVCGTDLGTISVNKEQQIYFGQPLIDAYLLQDEVNYYGIVAHNSIDSYLHTLDPELPAAKLFFEVKTPMKAGKITHRNIDWFYFLGSYKNSLTEEKREKLHYYLDSLKTLVSGAPRKYIDNTLEIFEAAYR